MTISMHGLKLDEIVWNHTPPASPVPRETSKRAFHYISDHQDLLWHPHNGRYYDSKSAFRRVTKAAGCEEVGNETQSRAVVRPDKGQIGGRRR
jgi:hypothetical protein